MGIIRNLSTFLINENTKVLGIAPQFTRFISEVELRKGIYHYYKLEPKYNYRFILKHFLNEITKDDSLIYIDNPNNPTGQIIDIKDIEEIVKKAKMYGIIVMIDEAYGDYMSPSNSSINLIGKYDNVVVMKSASKFYGLPNHRIGYLFADKEFIKVYNEITLPFPFSDLSANIFLNILNDYKKIESTKNKVIEINKKIYAKLNSNQYLYTNIETPIFTLKAKKNINLTQELQRKDIITESGKCFLNLDQNYSRIRINRNYKKIIKTINNLENF